MSSDPTNFSEANALLALTVADRMRAAEILGEMSRVELRELIDTAEELARMCAAIVETR